MNLIKESMRALGIEDFLPLPFTVNVFGKRGARAENVSSIDKISTEEIILCIKKESIIFRGEDLFICGFFGGDVIIKGKISSVEIKC